MFMRLILSNFRSKITICNEKAMASTIVRRGNLLGMSIIFLAIILYAIPASGVPFDKTRYIGVDEIKAGMKGYGKTVFHGTKIERFDVVVISVMKNIKPKRDAILIKCLDKRFDVANGVQGVSGSPVYFNDRLAGAMSFGWKGEVEPLYGVTPIRQMLAVQQTGELFKETSQENINMANRFDKVDYQNLMRETLLSPAKIKWLAARAGATTSPESDSATMATMLPVGLTMNGLTDEALHALHAFIPNLKLQVGAAGSVVDGDHYENVILEPGSSITIPLFRGDINGAALGTVTEVVDNHVFAFGHSWNGVGGVKFPMATAYIHSFVNLNTMSFKLGYSLDIVGTLFADEAAAIYGQVGDSVDLVPLEFNMDWVYLNEQETFNVEVVRDEKMTPLYCAIAYMNALLYRGGVPKENNATLDVKMTFDKIAPIEYTNIASGNLANIVANELFSVLGLIMNNPWTRVELTGLKLDMRIDSDDGIDVVKAVKIDKRYYKPGESVKVNFEIEPLRSGTFQESVRLQLPDDLPDGRYVVEVGGPKVYESALRNTKKHLFNAYDIDGVQRILQQRVSIPRNAIYMVIAAKGQGVAMDDYAFEYLPESRATLLGDASRSVNIVKYKQLLFASKKMSHHIAGHHRFTIQVKH